MLKDFLDTHSEDVIYHRNSYRRLLKFCLLLIFINAGLLGLIYYKSLSLETPKYFVTTTTGKLIEIFPS